MGSETLTTLRKYAFRGIKKYIKENGQNYLELKKQFFTEKMMTRRKLYLYTEKNEIFQFGKNIIIDLLIINATPSIKSLKQTKVILFGALKIQRGL